MLKVSHVSVIKQMIKYCLLLFMHRESVQCMEI